MKTFKIAIIGGNFGLNRSPSYVIGEIIKHSSTNPACDVVVSQNSGSFEHLIELSDRDYTDVDALIWMPNVSNDHEKLLPKIKKNNPHLVLVQSKRVIEKEYSDFDIVKRLLSSHSALGIKITKDSSYNYAVMDPLGNNWGTTKDIPVLVDVLVSRISDIANMTRVRSNRIDSRRDFELEEEFLEYVKEFGEIFAKNVKAANPDRYLGNSSTRCSHGFPSVRHDRTVYVSKRNVDKTIISADQFVEVNLDKDDVEYFGNDKPSVDTPIQTRLYEKYPSMNYMVHGHAYIKGAPFTKNNVPCGFLEEVDEIEDALSALKSVQPFLTHAVVNLRGHGCLIMSNDVDSMNPKHYDFYPRPFLEETK